MAKLDPVIATLLADTEGFTKALDIVAEELAEASARIAARVAGVNDADDGDDDGYVTYDSDKCAAPAPPSELDVMETLVGLFANLNNGAKIRVLDWARSRFVG